MTRANSNGTHQLILLELNEINFDIVDRYLSSVQLPAFEKLMAGSSVRTTAEQEYESLEPWIQWPSVHCGLSAAEHSVFRLGDILHSNAPQLFEQLENAGLRVGAISPMNAANRLNNPAYFIPDPWTKTPSDSSWWSRALTTAVSQAVNDNSKQSITPRSASYLALGLMRFAQPKHYETYLRLVSQSRGAPWRKALLLDLLLHDVHMRMFAARRPDFSALFLNAGAHIQHHYFFNAHAIRDQLEIRNPEWYIDATVDPFEEMLHVYELILRDYQSLQGVELIVATGLSQRPYDRVKFYYRLRNHAEFIRALGIACRAVTPRMTRDFLIEFDSAEQAVAAQRRLESVLVDADTPLFGNIDNRGTSLFVTLTYAREVTDTTVFRVDDRAIPLKEAVVFVAIKNGMHQGKGFAYFTPEVTRYAPNEGDHVKTLYGTITRYFGVRPPFREPKFAQRIEHAAAPA